VIAGNQCSKMAPETAEKANPASPATSAPTNTEPTFNTSMPIDGERKADRCKKNIVPMPSRISPNNAAVLITCRRIPAPSTVYGDTNTRIRFMKFAPTAGRLGF